MKKRNIAIIAAVALVIVVSVGYALFSETININGTATAKGTFDMQVTAVKNLENKGYEKVSVDPQFKEVTINEDHNGAKVVIDKLAYPGAFFKFQVTVTNKGTIPAKLKKITQTGLDSAAGPIHVTYTGIASGETVIQPNQSQTMDVTVTWVSTNNETATGATFEFALDYEQITVQ